MGLYLFIIVTVLLIVNKCLCLVSEYVHLALFERLNANLDVAEIRQPCGRRQFNILNNLDV
jgi:hypothetical protein